MIKVFRSGFGKITAALLIIIMVFLALVAVRKCYFRQLEKEAYSVTAVSLDQLNNCAGSKAKKLMIVAHPDDEVLWGGGHLMSGDWFILCITGGDNEQRSEEFRQVLEASGNEGMILSYPDKVGGRRNNWHKIKDNIKSDIETALSYKDWEQVAVHNQNGEYGHIHHINVHRYVTQLYDENEYDFPLYCFGKYYRKAKIDQVKDKLTPISDEEYEFKLKLSKIYVSQENTINGLWHMARYEMWTLYNKYEEHPSVGLKKDKTDGQKDEIDKKEHNTHKYNVGDLPNTDSGTDKI